ncbi:hypothetical protein ACNFG0_10065 [Pseudomonas sp. NY15372]|uniref:hypothetical protein n=1 Tax=Pseudomonas sp. NY15372 TaxID=3400356 RepID=UPI003A88D119
MQRYYRGRAGRLAPNISVTLSLSMTSELDLKTGESYYVSLTIQNQSNMAVKNIVITPRSGDDALLAVDTFNNVVDLSAEETRVIRMPVKALAAGTTTLQTAISVPPGFVNTGDRQVHAKAVIVTQRDLNVTQILKGHWKKVWDQPEWIYSYGLTLSSASARVVKWRLSFLLLDGAKLDPDWLETQKHWLEVDEEASTEGYIALTNKSGHTVEPGATLPLDIQVLYPEESNQYNQLHNIRLRQLQ